MPKIKISPAGRNKNGVYSFLLTNLKTTQENFERHYDKEDFLVKPVSNCS